MPSRQAELAPHLRGGCWPRGGAPVESVGDRRYKYEESRRPPPPAFREVIRVTVRSGRDDCCIRRACSSFRMLPIRLAGRVKRNARIETQNASQPPAPYLLPERAERRKTVSLVRVRPPRLRCSARSGTPLAAACSSHGRSLDTVDVMGLVKRQWEEYSARGLGPVAGSMCPAHIRDTYLRDTLLTTRVDGTCFACGREGSDQVEADELLGYMTEVATRGLQPPDDPYAHTFETSELFWELFEDLFDVEDPVDIFEYLLASDQTNEWAVPYFDTLWDEDQPDETPSGSWLIFKDLVQHQSRFIFLAPAATGRTPEQASAAAEFVAYFTGVIFQYESSIVREIEPGTVFYRGRMVSHPDAGAAFGAADLGPAPAERAAASRMSPAGIPMLYASETQATAVAEIAAHDPEQREYAVVGGLRLLRPLRVIDLVDIDVPSLFDEARSNERWDKKFLTSFARDISRPIRLDGQEHREYAPTQVLTEVIRWSTSPLVDGIRYLSARDSSPTYVLFFGPGAVVSERDGGGAGTFTLNQTDIATFRLRRHVSMTPVSEVLLGDDEG